MHSSVEGSSTGSAERDLPSPCKIWRCSVCSRIESVLITTETDLWWFCDAPVKRNAPVQGEACWVDDKSDGEMTFSDQATSIRGGGLQGPVHLVKHDRRLWGCCCECSHQREFRKIAQECATSGCSGIMIIKRILSELPASRG